MAIWHGFYALRVNDRIMNDLLLLIATFAGTYLCSMAFTFILARLIFPFKTKAEMAATIDRGVAQRKNVPLPTRIILPLLTSQGNLTLNR
jgi:hypothetical protein